MGLNLDVNNFWGRLSAWLPRWIQVVTQKQYDGLGWSAPIVSRGVLLPVYSSNPVWVVGTHLAKPLQSISQELPATIRACSESALEVFNDSLRKRARISCNM